MRARRRSVIIDRDECATTMAAMSQTSVPAQSTLRTRTAVVTGASSGIGAATARRSPPRASTWSAPPAVPTGSRRSPPRSAARAVTCDVTAAGVGRRAGRRGRRHAHVLVNNAGGAFGAAPVAEADSDDWRADVRGQRDRPDAGHPGPAARAARQRRRADRQRRLDRRPDRLRGRRRLHRGQARHPGRHRDAAARALGPAGPGLRDRARDGATDEFALVRFDGRPGARRTRCTPA